MCFPSEGVGSAVLLHTVYMFKQTCLLVGSSPSEPVVSPFLVVVLPRPLSDGFLLSGTPRRRLALFRRGGRVQRRELLVHSGSHARHPGPGLVLLPRLPRRRPRPEWLCRLHSTMRTHPNPYKPTSRQSKETRKKKGGNSPDRAESCPESPSPPAPASPP